MGRELIPADLFAPATPLLDPDWVVRRRRGAAGCSPETSINIRGVQTSAATVADAEPLARSVLRDLEQAIRDGDRTSIWKMVQDRPVLMLIPMFRDRLSRWILNRSLRAPPGRPRGSTLLSPLLVVALVDHLVSTRAVPNPDIAFSRLNFIGIGYDSAKRLYAQAFREDRFRALLLLDEEKARPVQDQDLAWMASAERLTADHQVVRNWFDPALGGLVEARFQA